MKLTHLENNYINTELWDKCISNSVNGCVFAYSWYLNQSCPGWNALVNENYSIVMPLPNTKLWGTPIIYKPTFSTHLGIFSTQPFDNEVLKNFIASIPNEYKHVQLVLDKFNIGKIEISKNFGFEQTFELDLISNYQQIKELYNNFLKEKLEIIENSKLNMVGGIQLIDLLQLYVANPNFSSHKLNEAKLKQLRNIGLNCLRNNAGEIIGAYDSNNNLCAAAIFLSSHNKAHLVFHVQNKFALKNFVLDFLVDYFIKRHSEKNLTLSVPKICATGIDFQLFGAIPVSYPKLYINKLPVHLEIINFLTNNRMQNIIAF